MDRMLTAVAKLAGASSRNDDDVVDRLHNRYTVLFLVIFAVVVSTNQYVGTPINCWAPAYFTDNHQRYTDRVIVFELTVPYNDDNNTARVDLSVHNERKIAIAIIYIYVESQVSRLSLIKHAE